MEVQVRPKLTIKCFFIIGLVLGITAAGTLMSTENYMNVLPNSMRYKCADCHVSTSPTTVSNTLNNFGADFQSNGMKWDATLAAKDSDGDGYKNGYELGDQNGDGKADAAFERSNPGDRNNTPNSVDRKTWGTIKSLFED
jgi:hypothetical protein